MALPAWISRWAIRLELIDGVWRVVTRRRRLPGNTAAAEPQEHPERLLTMAESVNVEQALARLNLWALPVLVYDDAIDGTSWLIEGSEGSRYHVVVRHCTAESDIVHWCYLTRSLSGLGKH
jgi:hypothetical protein